METTVMHLIVDEVSDGGVIEETYSDFDLSGFLLTLTPNLLPTTGGYLRHSDQCLKVPRGKTGFTKSSTPFPPLCVCLRERACVCVCGSVCVRVQTRVRTYSRYVCMRMTLNEPVPPPKSQHVQSCFKF